MRGKSSSCGCLLINDNKNPNPLNFNILSNEYNDNFTAIVVHYPDADNYEGKKILVYKGNVIKELQEVKELDPHFCDKHLSPIARFAPTDEGIKLAKFLMKNYIME